MRYKMDLEKSDAGMEDYASHFARHNLHLISSREWLSLEMSNKIIFRKYSPCMRQYDQQVIAMACK
jgi:hypothetical protein